MATLTNSGSSAFGSSYSANGGLLSGGAVNGGFASQDAQLQCYADWLNAGSPDIQGQNVDSGIPLGAGAKSFGDAEAIALRIAKEELDRTERITDGYRLGGHNDLYDAERHARWTYRMSMEIGSGWAQVFALGHEVQVILSQPIIEMRMDITNNALGMQAAMNGSGIPTLSSPGLVYIANDDIQGY
jgi:hypothetical protein